MAFSVTPSILLPTTFLAAVPGLLFTAAGTTGVIITKASFAAIGSSGVRLTLWRLPGAFGAPADGFTITSGVLVSPDDVPYVAEELGGLVLLNGDSIWGQATIPNALTGTISGLNYA